MKGDDLPLVSPNQAALFLAYVRLVGLLDRNGILPTEDVVTDLRNYADSLPEQARPLFRSLIESLSPGGSRLHIVPDSVEVDPENDPDAA